MAQREKLYRLFDKCKFEKYANTTEMYMIKILEKYYSVKYIMYGAGRNVRATLNYVMKTEGIPIEYIIDKDPQIEEIEGVCVISREKFSEINREKEIKWCAFVSLGAYGDSDKITDDIEKYLYSEGVIKIIQVASQVTGITKNCWYDYFITNREEFCKMNNIFADDLSKETYYEFIRAYLEGHRYQGKTWREESKYFLSDEDIIVHLENEQWINFGAYTGDTIYYFISNGYNFEQIYAVEGDDKTAKRLEENLSFLPVEIKNKIKIVNKYFGGEGNLTIDDYFMDQRITYINMDIEGYEQELLRSAERVIKINRPILAICVYHQMDDLIVIPDLICELVDEYSFFLRKYPSLVGAYFNGYFELNELVLYAVPNERLKRKE